MNKMIVKLGTSIATLAIIASAIAPAVSAQGITISGNGRKSNNTVNVTKNNTTNVSQNSTTNTLVGLGVFANTGGNKANDNAGNTTVNITSGNVNSTLNASVTAGDNTANVTNCGCNSTTNIAVTDNGRRSNNTVNVKENDTTNVTQKNITNTGVFMVVFANTGDNTANDNGSGAGGAGDPSIKSGNVNTGLNVGVSGGSNSL